MLVLFLKAKALGKVWRRIGGKLPETEETAIASKAAATQQRALAAVSERGVLKAGTSGGTSLECVIAHVEKTRPASAVIVTDGYVEDDVKWNISSPTLWMVTGCKSFEPPSGRKVMVDYDG